MFIDERFPDKISFNATGGAGFSTLIVVTASGAESRLQEWEYERAEYEVAHAARMESEWRPLLAFHRIMRGRANSFRFKDWTDYICASGEGIFVDSDGSPVGKQMIKRYTFGGEVFYRKITKPVLGTITIIGGGTLNYDYGIVDGGSPTAWYGEFDIHCRFDVDVMRHITIDKSSHEGLIVGWQSISIVEVRDDD